MTINEIKIILEREINDAVANPDIAAWVYSAMVEIAKEYGRIVEWELWAWSPSHGLPADCLAISAVFDDEGEQYYDFTISEFGQISFEKVGTFKVQYFAMPAALPTVESTMLATAPEVHLIFHPAIVDWCKHKYWNKEASVLGVDPGESGFADKFKMSFYQQIATSALVLKNRAYKKRKIRMV